MQFTVDLPKHFLNKRAKELLAKYSALGDARSPQQHAKLVEQLLQANANAFHTEKTLNTRKFFHCPAMPIPYHSCIVPPIRKTESKCQKPQKPSA